MPQGIGVDGGAIKGLRKAARLSRQELASLIGISAVGVWKVETNGRTTLSTLRSLADALMVHPTELMETPEDYALLQAAPRDRPALANAMLRREAPAGRSEPGSASRRGRRSEAIL